MSSPLTMFGLLLLVAGAPHLAAAPAPLRRHAATLLPLAMLLLPLLPHWLAGAPPGYRLVVPPTRADLAPGLWAALVVLPAFHLLILGGVLPAPANTVHVAWADLPMFTAVHLLQTVLPEELFFRGYLQERWDSGLGLPVLGVRVHRGLVLQALAFGLLHVVSYGLQPAAFDRALPGLLFGAVRERSGSLWSPILLHLLCNLWLFLR